MPALRKDRKGPLCRTSKGHGGELASPFQIAAQQLLQSSFALHWQSPFQSQGAKTKAASKTKFICPVCRQNAWAKAHARLICGACYEEDGEVQEIA